eukprot:TRINITY_DN13455_c0_g1_i1.p1 TRINITY_DN13455_c0_g1~~TRINITY_DN13455_c0_g1_i1.p1  ORF type:complete len:208 (+),score=68.25 TRINITY_DN13455_c0_g1_i1:43-624(+)
MASSAVKKKWRLTKEKLIEFVSAAENWIESGELRQRVLAGISLGQSAGQVLDMIHEETLLSIGHGGFQQGEGRLVMAQARVDHGSDLPLMLRLCDLCSREEAECDEVTLTPLACAQKKMQQQLVQQQQAEFLKQMSSASADQLQKLLTQVEKELRLMCKPGKKSYSGGLDTVMLQKDSLSMCRDWAKCHHPSV